MGKVASKSLLSFLILFSYVSFTYSAGIESSFNGLTLDLDEKVEEYSFLLGGHLYGAHGKSVFPSPSLLANIDMINSRGAKFFISLGDNFRSADPVHILNYQKAFASKLKIPLFNAVGNHDMSNRELYEANFGKTYYHFVYNNELFVILDSELDDGNIMDDQLDFFLATIRNAIKKPEIKNAFIFSHKLIWDVNNPDYQIVFEHANEPYPDNNFADEIKPVLVELSKHKTVYWVSGDIGTRWSLPLFYEKGPNHNINYIAVGIGDTARDALLQVSISKTKGTIFTAISLSGQELDPIETYDVGYWKGYFEDEPEGERTESVFGVYWGKVYRMVHHNYFYGGIFVGIFAAGFGVLLLRRSRG